MDVDRREDEIVRSILIDAPVDTVWSVLTEPEHLSAWFGDSATIELEPGGRATFGWTEHGNYQAVIERAEPPHTLAFRWVRRNGMEPSTGNSTLVVVTLLADGDRTHLQLVESGFASLEWPTNDVDDYRVENAAGWTSELGELREYAATVWSSADA